MSPVLTCHHIRWLLQILACDGIFDVLTNQEASVDGTQPGPLMQGASPRNALPLQHFCVSVWHTCLMLVTPELQVVDFVRKRLKAGESPKAICAQACDHCLAEDTEGCGKG